MLFQFEESTPLSAVTITSSASPDVVIPAAVTYKSRWIVNVGTGITTAFALVPAFAASTAYLRGQFVQSGWIIYSAKVDFTSGASFSASDWNAFGSNVVGTTQYRWIAIYVRKNSAGAFVAFSEVGPLTDFTADGIQYANGPFDSLVDPNACLIWRVLVYGTGGAVTIGTTNLSATNSVIVVNPSAIGG